MRLPGLLLKSTVVALLATTSCTNQETNPCKSPQLVTADNQCYAGNGLKLTTSEYGDKPLSFEWSIIALKDTSAVLGWTPKDEKIRMIAANSFTVPDSLATSYQRLIVRVAANCQGLLKQSPYFAFKKTRSAAANCTVWTPQASK